MRVLFFSGNAATVTAPPRLGEQQVNCGPGFADTSTEGGRILSLATPTGRCDLAALIAKLPADQQPDVVACEIAAERPDLLHNLAAVRCPTVALVTGTHAGRAPLTTVLRYLAAERFDQVTLVDNRQHAAFFHAAGVRNLHWFPGLLFPHSDAVVRAARRTLRESRLAVGAAGGGESPRQTRLLQALAQRGVPHVRQKSAGPAATLKHFGSSFVGFNASENGELNLRSFEILAVGAALLTDRLAPESGFEELFLERREVAAYGSATELANVAQELLARPDEARALGEAGARWFDEFLSERHRRELFRLLAFEGISTPEFALPITGNTRMIFGGDSARLAESVTVYEGVQSLHRTQETVRVAIDRDTPDDVVSIYSTLPRVTLSRLNEADTADLAILRRADEDAPGVAQAARRWFYEETANEANGASPAQESAALREAFALARRLEDEGQLDAAGKTLCDAVECHGETGGAARALGDFLKRRGRLGEAMAWHRRALGCAEPESKISTDRRRRVLIVVQQGSLWPSLASVYAAFDADPAWETIVIAMPCHHPDFTSDAQRNAIFGFLRRQNIPYVRWDEFPLRAGSAEVVFLPDPFDETRPAGWGTADLVRHGVRIAYVPFGFETANSDEGHLRHYDSPLHRFAWAIFAWSEAHRAMFHRHCAVGGAHVVVTGHPKTDALRKLDAARDPELERFVAGRKAVCWNPHFDLRPDGRTPFGTGRSTFARWQDFFLAEFARRPDLAFIVRPHPLFFAKLERAGILTARQLDAFVDRCADTENVRLDRRASYLPAFAASSAMLSDLSSFVLEFAGTGRPMLYLRNPHGPPLERHAIADDFCAVAETESEVVRFLDLVEAGEDEGRAAQRRAGYRKCLHLPAEGAGLAVKRAVERRLLDEEHGVVPDRAIVAA